jgi:hypothetical protein
MTNLSDLFPAGAGKQVSFTASGNVTSSGKPVILNSDGTVSEVSGSSSTIGAQAEFSSSTPDYIDTAASSNYLVVIYKRSSGIRIRAGEVSGSTITWGAETDVFYSATHWSGYPAICYDSTNDKFIISWTERDTYFTNFRCQPLSVASSGLGAVVTLGTASQVHTTAGTGSYAYNSMAYCPDTDHFIMVNSISLGNWYGTAFVGQLGSGGTTVDVNTTAYTFKSVNSTDYINVGYDENADRFVISYHASSTSSVVTALAAGSGASSSLTFGTETNLPANAYNVFPIYDSSISKTVLVYKTQSNQNGEAKVATVGSTTITLASTAYIWQSNSDAPYQEMIAATYDSNLNQVIISWRQTASPYASLFLGASVSGEVITYSTATTAFGSPTNTQYKSLSFLSGANLSLLAVADVGYGYGYSKMIAPASTNVTASNFLGISDAAISSAATGNITIKGGIASTGLSSLTPASDYYVQNDGTITTVSSDVKAGKALSATAINLEYQS